MSVGRRRNEKIEKRAKKMSALERRMLWEISPDNNAGVGWTSKADEFRTTTVVDCPGSYQMRAIH